MPHAQRPHVLIVGCGFGGLEAARALRHASVDVTVIDRSNHHLFQPLLYQVATGGLSAPSIAAPARSLFRRQRNATTLLGEVVGIDAAGQRVALADGSQLSFDHLIVAAGATHSYFGHDDWAAHAPGLKSLDDAFEIRRRLLLAFERAERRADAESLTFVVVGGGPTGVELAGTMAEIARHTLRDEFRRIDPARARVVLLEGGPRVLAAMPETLSESARQQLQALGVDVRAGARVTHIDAAGLQIEGAGGSYRLESACTVWAAGVAASPLGRMLSEATGCPLDRAGRVVVSPDLSVPGHPSISVIGDLAAAHSHAPGRQPQPVPGVSPGCQANGPHGRAQPAGAAGRKADAALPLPRPWQLGHSGPTQRRGGLGHAPGPPALFRLGGLGVLAVRPRLLPDRLSQPVGGADGLGLGLLDARAARPRRHPAATARLIKRASAQAPRPWARSRCPDRCPRARSPAP